MHYYFSYKLDCNSLLVEKTQEILKETWDFKLEYIKHIDLGERILEILNTELNIKGIPNLLYATCFARGKGHTQGIHVDGTNGITNSSLNIPVTGCEKTEMQWFDGNYTIESRSSVNSTGMLVGYNIVKWPDPDKITIADRLELRESHMVRVNAPHRSIANNDYPRAVLCLRFVGNPTFEELYEKLAVG